MTYYPSQVTQHYLGYAWVLLNLLDMISWLMELESTGLLSMGQKLPCYDIFHSSISDLLPCFSNDKFDFVVCKNICIKVMRSPALVNM